MLGFLFLGQSIEQQWEWLMKALMILLGTIQYLPLYHLQKKLKNNRKNAENPPGAIAVATDGT